MGQYPMNYQYGNPYGIYQNGMPQSYQPMDRLAQLQQQQFQTMPQYQQPQAQSFGLNGEIVDSIDVVKAKNVDMSGNPVFYPRADLSEIYVKQLQAGGMSKTDIYRKVVPDVPQEPIQPTVNMEMLNGMFGQLKQDFSNEIGELKELIYSLAPAEPPKTQRGGSQK